MCERSSKHASVRGVCGNAACEQFAHESYLSCPEDCHSLRERVRALRGGLLDAGFSVRRGAFEVFRTEDCSDLERCWYNNPTSPYAVFGVPLADGEPDPDPEGRGGRLLSDRNLFRIFRLDPSEAIVWIGRTPPGGYYFSFTPYLYSRYDPEGDGVVRYGNRAEVYGSLGDSINNVTISTSAGESSFGAESVVIMTGDRGVDARVREVLGRAGLGGDIANTLVVPQRSADGETPLVKLGLGEEADILSMLMRIAHGGEAEMTEELAGWLADPRAHVLRVRMQETHAEDPYALPARRIPGSGAPESGNALHRLVRSIEDAFEEFITRTSVLLPYEHLDGLNCIDALYPCYADCRDTPYMAARYRLESEREALIVVGRNHEASGRASYVNITSTRYSDATAFYSVLMTELAGSAAVFLPGDPAAADHWQLMFARDCAGAPYCFEVTEDQVPLDDRVSILVRAYLDPATGTRAKVHPFAQSELQFPRVIKVTCPLAASDCNPASFLSAVR